MDICLLQETKLQNMEDLAIYFLWGNKEVNWMTKRALGKFGGMILMWKPSLFEVFSSFIGEGFVRM